MHVCQEFAHMGQDSGHARKLGQHEYVILVDHRENTSLADVRRTLQHEACHIQVDLKESEEHGLAFQECMTRFR